MCGQGAAREDGQGRAAEGSSIWLPPTAFPGHLWLKPSPHPLSLRAARSPRCLDRDGGSKGEMRPHSALELKELRTLPHPGTHPFAPHTAVLQRRIQESVEERERRGWGGPGER